MKTKLYIILALIPVLGISSAHANWQYQGRYTSGGSYVDDGSRFTLSLRGGAAIQSATMKNDVGALSAGYYTDGSGSVISAGYYDACVTAGGCTGYAYAGDGNIGDLPTAQGFNSFEFAAGASIGWIVPNSPQWRMELGFDHVSETQYNAAPLFDGNLVLKGGATNGLVVPAQSGGAYASATTDVISAMAFYDFFDGKTKKLREFIPYVGFGIGYADTTTTLALSDLYGDLSMALDLQNYGTLNSYNILQFYKSETSNSNVAGLLALGFSYGLTENMFLDFGARFTYIPEIQWSLTNSDATKSRDWFSANNVIYTDLMVGVRFEF